MFKNNFFKIALLGTLISSHALYATIDDTYFADLPAPFNQLSVTGGTYRAPDPNAPEVQLCTDYKRDIILNIFNREMQRAQDLSVPTSSRNMLEIGTGSGYMTGEFLHHIYNQRQSGTNTNYDNTLLFTIDDFRDRPPEENVRGYIDIEGRVDFVLSEPNYVNGKIEFQQMLGRLVAKEVEEAGTIPKGALLNLLVLPRRTSTANGTEYFANDGDDVYVDPVGREGLFSAALNGADESQLEEITRVFNGGNRFGLIWIDTDLYTAGELTNTLIAAWNVLADGGAIVVDDYDWQHTTPGTSAPLSVDILAFLHTHFAAINSGFGGPDFATDDYSGLYVYDGSDSAIPTPTIGDESLSTTDTAALPVVEFHNIWTNSGRWITVIHREPTVSSDIVLEVP